MSTRLILRRDSHIGQVWARAARIAPDDHGTPNAPCVPSTIRSSAATTVLNVRARDREHLRPARLRLDRPRRPARPVPLVGPLHPAQARHRRRQDRASWSREELDDEYFMLRVRIDGGQLTTDAAARDRRASPPSSRRDTADITDRQNIQYHWIRIEDVPEIWQRLEAVGLHDRGLRRLPARRSSARPVAGIAADEIIDGTPAIDEIERRYIGDPEFSNLPRKFKTAITGHPSLDVAPEINDIVVRRRRPPRARPRLRPLGRRRPVHQPDARPAARRLGPARRGRRRLGGRHLGLPRLRLPAAAHPGPAEVPGRRLGRGEVPRGARGRVPRPRAGRRPRRRQRPTRRRRPRRRAPAEGRPLLRRRRPDASAGSPARCSRGSPTSSRQHGADRVRPRRTRSWSCSTSTTDQVDGAASPRSSAHRPVRPPVAVAARHDGLHRHRVLQARDRRDQGSARADADRRARAAAARTSTTPITINVNGCPNACARIQVADIGLKGQLVLDADGEQVEGFQVHLGGGARAATPGSAASCAATRSPAPSSPTTSTNVRHGVPRRSATTASLRAWVARPTRTRCAARSAPTRSRDERRAASRSTARTAATRTCAPARTARRLGVPRLPAGLLAEVPRPDRPRTQTGAIMTATTTASPRLQGAPAPTAAARPSCSSSSGTPAPSSSSRPPR